MRLNFKKAKIRRKLFYDVLESVKHYKDWMFLSNDLTQIKKSHAAFCPWVKQKKTG